ncbi:hypothetical protein FA95DRAFT_1506916 [Auriscalpium vulgare]|uniref:Uncharacterized protein n=1 Tax=Auriscalpium vulgare TaxID=40419 RepID=A0ACB8R0Q3_9AGAM|nr:hypothetical protein FA95DRAFT_1506916 [Auriscalpium vulgare]
MAGHTAIYGDRFSMMRGAVASLSKGSKAQYYPSMPPKHDKYNPHRPVYDYKNLPLRNEHDYRETLEQLSNANTKAARAKITRDTGVSRMPLCMAMPAFLHPSFFPLDPFHLIYENCMAYLYDVWTVFSSPGEKMHLTTAKARKFGRLVSEAVVTLPPVFSGPIRDPFLKRQSQYKIYEWMALLHWYIIPIGTEIGFHPTVLANFAKFAEIADFAMAIQPRSKEDLKQLHTLIAQFLKEYERIYVGDDPEKVSRCRLCIMQLIHIPTHIEWYGSIRLGSQATVERAIGEIGRKVRSRKAPFANVATIIYERELLRLLLLHVPSLQPQTKDKPKRIFIKEVRILKSDIKKPASKINTYISAICQYIGQSTNQTPDLQQWAKHVLPNKHTLTSELFESLSTLSNIRSSKFFEATEEGSTIPIFGRAVAFFEVLETAQKLVVFYPMINLKQSFNRWKGNWSPTIQVCSVSQIRHMVGVIQYEDRVHILRKHPGLSMLTPEELGIVDSSVELDTEPDDI